MLVGGIITVLTTQQLIERYSNLSDPAGRISRDVKNGKLIPLVKGLYETNPDTHGALLAQTIYGPSYLSFDYALYSAGLIPEAVYSTFTSATYNKRKIKTYKNKFGTFIYRDVPSEVFCKGVLIFVENGYSYHMATPEKALCDKLYSLPPAKNSRMFYEMLFEDLRIDETTLFELNRDEIISLAPLYRSTNLYRLERLLKGRK